MKQILVPGNIVRVVRWLFFLLSLSTIPVQAIEVIDDTGQLINLEQPAKRIISLAPHATELLFSIGAGDKVIGVVKYSDFPEAAKKIPQVGGYKKLDLERIVSLQPDLIVAWQTGNRPTEMTRLQELGLKVFYTEPRRLADIASLLKRMGQLTGNRQRAEQAAESFMQQYRLIKNKYKNKNKLRAFYLVWDNPLMTINGEHLISDVMQLCGLNNVFSEIENLVPRVNVEAVLNTNPQVIIAGGISKVKPQWKKQWQRWPELSASQLNALIEINPDIIQRHSPRILLGASELCEKVEVIRSRVK
jgi:iron complex transport system substrate-binding protein